MMTTKKQDEVKKFETNQAALKFANTAYKNYGFNASVYKATNKETNHTFYYVIDPIKAGLKKK